MELTIDMTHKECVVTKNPEPRIDSQTAMQRLDKSTGEPVWSTELVVTDHTGGEIIKVATRGAPPDVSVGEVVVCDNLNALPWFSNNRAGVSYRADSIKAVED